tara:strand:+ start:103 stop:297 length:195 start_codon:yes stop_codon:yes gene_type:complete
MKFGMYTKGTNESRNYINLIEMSNRAQAEAYFAGVKQLSLEQFRNLFVVKEISSGHKDKNLLLG